jgi:hypothetical protein
MGWSRLRLAQPDCPLWQGIPDGAYVYFVHSYYAVPEGDAGLPPPSLRFPPLREGNHAGGSVPLLAGGTLRRGFSLSLPTGSPADTHLQEGNSSLITAYCDYGVRFACAVGVGTSTPCSSTPKRAATRACKSCATSSPASEPPHDARRPQPHRATADPQGLLDGDLVHASPVAAALKRAFPHLHIGWIAEDRHAGVLADSPRIDRLHIIPHRELRERPFGRAARQTVLRLTRELRAERYQVALDLQGLLKSAVWGVLGGVPIRYGAHRMRELTLLLLRRIPIPDCPRPPCGAAVSGRSAVAGCALRVPRPLHAPDDAYAPEPPVEFPLYVPDTARQQVACKLAPLGIDDQPLISMNPSAGRAVETLAHRTLRRVVRPNRGGMGHPRGVRRGTRRQAAGGATCASQAASAAQPDWAHQPERGDGGCAAVCGTCVRRHGHSAYRGGVPRACRVAVRTDQPRPHRTLRTARSCPLQATPLYRLPTQPLHPQRVPAVDYRGRGDGRSCAAGGEISQSLGRAVGIRYPPRDGDPHTSAGRVGIGGDYARIAPPA